MQSKGQNACMFLAPVPYSWALAQRNTSWRVSLEPRPQFPGQACIVRVML